MTNENAYQTYKLNEVNRLAAPSSEVCTKRIYPVFMSHVLAGAFGYRPRPVIEFWTKKNHPLGYRFSNNF